MNIAGLVLFTEKENLIGSRAIETFWNKQTCYPFTIGTKGKYFQMAYPLYSCEIHRH